MQNFGRGNSGTASLVVKGILLLVGIIILVAIAKTIVTIVVSILTLAVIVIGIWLLLKFLSRNNNNRYF
jgi:hypothetical protein